MSRFMLRYEFIDVPLTDGELVAGRAPECDLVMDDAAVSRRHVSFQISGDDVLVRDLNSRNGVLVNGAQLDEPMRLRHGDRVRVGTKELTVHDTTRSRRKRSTGTTELIRCDVCGSLRQPQEACAQCALQDEALELPTVSVAVMGETEDTQAAREAGGAPPRAAGGFGTLSRLADRALDMGKAAEAERLLSSTLQKILARAGKGEALGNGEAPSAAHYALRLARVTGQARWADYPLELYAALDAVMPQDLVEQLYGLVGPLKYTHAVPLRRYIGQLREQEARLGSNDRFILSRLEGLARMVGGR